MSSCGLCYVFLILSEDPLLEYSSISDLVSTVHIMMPARDIIIFLELFLHSFASHISDALLKHQKPIRLGQLLSILLMVH
jgi:hypothetical protein